MAGVQFFGKAAVLDAFESRGIDTWAIFQNKNMVFVGEGPELLETILDKLEGGSCIYTLTVFNNGIPSNQITNRTENNGAFNFKLDKEARAVGNVQRAGGGDPIMMEINNLLAQEVREVLRERLSGIKKDEPKEESWTDILKETLKTNPQVVVQTIGAIKDFFNTGNVSAFAPMALGAVTPQIAGMKKPETTLHSAEGVDIDQARWESVLERLENVDPDILIHLEKLATLAEKEPGKYKMALSFL